MSLFIFQSRNMKLWRNYLSTQRKQPKLLDRSMWSTHLTWVCPLVWKYPDQYWKHIIFPGPFHTKMNFIGMLTKKKVRESGYAEILIEVKLVTSGTLVRVLSGKASLKALFNLKAGVEALEWSLCQRKWYWNPPRSFTESHQLHAHPIPVVNRWIRSFKASQLPTLPTNTKNFK